MNPCLKTKWEKHSFPYTGRELRPHFLLSQHGIRGSGLLAWVGPCRVETDALVDWEDRLAQDRIESQLMVHFLAEFFEWDLAAAVTLQRLWIARLGEWLADKGVSVLRNGDDCFIEGRKLTVSIVTASPVSRLLHLGINVDPTGAPVPAIGLTECGISAEDLIPALLEAFADEVERIHRAMTKVRPVFT